MHAASGMRRTEIGKPHWESLTEVDAMINKVPVSIAALLLTFWRPVTPPASE